jgi:hypothetical protein
MYLSLVLHEGVQTTEEASIPRQRTSSKQSILSLFLFFVGYVYPPGFGLFRSKSLGIWIKTQVGRIER